MRAGIFTDPHCGGAEISNRTRYPSRSPDKMRRAAEYFRAAGVELLICCGDLIAGGGDREEEMRYLREAAGIIRGSGIPYLGIQGNHDLYDLTRGEFYAVSRLPEPPFLTVCGDTGIVALDACHRTDGNLYNPKLYKPDWTDTYIPRSQLDRLRDLLESENGPRRFMIISHQCLDPGVESRHIVSNAAEVRGIIDRCGRGRVERVVCGHYHTGAHSTIGGVDYLTLPAMCEGADYSRDCLCVIEI